MAIYLQVRAGPVGLLLDALRVHEVITLPDDFRADQAFADWRGRVLHVVRLAGQLQLPPGEPAQGVVYSPSEGDEPVMLCLDEVARLRNLEGADWNALPPSVPAPRRAAWAPATSLASRRSSAARPAPSRGPSPRRPWCAP